MLVSARGVSRRGVARPALDAGHPITAAMPPGDEKYFRLAMDVARNYTPLAPHEEQALLSRATGVEPIFHLGNDV